MKRPVDHVRRLGGNYQSKPATSEQLRQILAERMKEFNCKTGKLTALQNHRLKRSRVANRSGGVKSS